MAYNLMPAEQGENKLFYRLDGETAERHGAIGYMRVDFGHSGKLFFNSWLDSQRHLKTQDFKHEFDGVINSLRNDGQEPPFASRGNLQKFCFANKGLNLSDAVDGFKLQTLNYTYAVYCSPFRGDYDTRVYAYDNRYLLPELAGKHDMRLECFSVLPSTGKAVQVRFNESWYYPCDWSTPDKETNRRLVTDANTKLGVSRQQEEAMLAGSMFGWDTPAAKPWNYNENGKPRPLPQKNKNEPDRG
jgi:hypothetical protein